MHPLIKISLPVLAILAFHVLFLVIDAYSLQNLDSMMHFFGGIALGLSVARLLDYAVMRHWCPDPGRWLRAVLVISLVGSAALCWEIYEWLSDHYLDTWLQITLADTIKDMALGLAGGAASAWLLDRLQRGARAALVCRKQTS